MPRRLLTLLAALLAAIAPAAAANDDPLPPDQAYLFEVKASADTLYVNWDILPDYYLYRPKISFASKTDGIVLGEPQFPKGKVKEDEFFGKTEIYRGKVRIPIPYRIEQGTGNRTLLLQIKSQGCADIGLCYPPQTWQAQVVLASESVVASASDNLLQALGGRPDFGVSGAEFLAPEDAFQLIAEMADDYTIRVRWLIAEGYYLYKDKFGFSGSSELAQLGAAVLPPGKAKHDEFFGDVEVYYEGVDILVPISRASPGPGELELTVDLQGCAEDGICYPPMTRTTLIGISSASTEAPAARAQTTGGKGAAPATEQDALAAKISSGSLPLVLLTFFGLGLLLAFTPCVLPMVPILSGIIVGQGQITTKQSFVLSLIYVLAMALTYTVAGVVVALLGQNVQAFFQNPIIIVAFSLIFVTLALAMFGVYELQVPAALQTRLSSASNKQSGGSLIGVGVMGVLSALIVGPCVAAPLVAVLIFIGQSGDAVRGGLTLFALSMGMGAPLLVFGASAGRLAVKAGAWMNTVKQLFGIMLLGVAIWMLARILPPRLIMLLWGALAIATGVVLGALAKPQRGGAVFARVVGIAVLAYGGVLAASAAVGGNDPLNPLRGTPWHTEKHLDFTLVKTVAELDAAVAGASAEGRAVMLDFYADWCVSCKEMEKYTFTADAVHTALGNTVLLQADVTANDSADQALLKRFGIYGPPTIAFFDAAGTEIASARVVGFMDAPQFATHINRALDR